MPKNKFLDRKILSLCVIAKNEEKHVERFIAAWDGWFDEIIICDTGSSDRTKEIAAECGAIVVEFPWCDDFSAARNAACAPATSEWIFCPDMDEIIVDPEKFYTFLASVPDWVNAVQMDLHTAWANYVDLNNKGAVVNYFPAQRCFKRGTHEWAGAGHEFIRGINGNTTKMGYCRDAHFEHHPDTTKPRNYIGILRKQANEYPKDGRYLHYMGREAMYHGLNAEAIGYFNRTLEHHKWDYERCQTRLYMANCYIGLDEKDKALEQLILSLMEEPSRRESTFAIAEFYRSQEDWNRAAIWYKMCAAVDKPNTGYFMNDELYGALPLLRLAHCYWQLKDLNTAKYWYDTAKKLQPDHPEVINNARLFDIPKVGIVIPTRFREDTLNKCLEAIKTTASCYPNIDVCVFRDEQPEPLGCPKATNKAVETALNREGKPEDWVEPTYICFLGNDSIPQPGWLGEAMMLMKTFPDGKGMVGFNNGYNHCAATHFVIHKDLIRALPEGKMFHEGYSHNFVDNELTERMDALRRYRWAPRAKVFHTWYAQHGTTPEVPLRNMDECDQRASSTYMQDSQLFAERRSQWYKEPVYGVQIMAGPNEPFLEEVIDRLLTVFKPEQITGVVGEPIIEGDYDPAEWDNTSTIKVMESRGVNILQSSDRDEVTRRNFALGQGTEDWTFIVDADELWDTEAIRDVLHLTKSTPGLEAVAANMYTYWKTPEWRIDPPEPRKPPVCIKKGVKFAEGRNVNAQIMAYLNKTYIHHMSYVGDDERILKKLKFLQHPNLVALHPLIPGWFENVWKKWDENHELENLHPTHPECYKRAVRVTPLPKIGDTAPPKWFGAIYDRADKITGATTREELQKLAELSKDKTVVEMGCDLGRSSVLLASVANKFYTVDNFSYRAEAKEHFLKNMTGLNYTLLEEDSSNASTKVTEPIDVLFIDGDHTAPSVEIDIKSWVPKVKVGGYVALHDCNHYFEGYDDKVDELLGKDCEIVGTLRVYKITRQPYIVQ